MRGKSKVVLAAGVCVAVGCGTGVVIAQQSGGSRGAEQAAASIDITAYAIGFAAGERVRDNLRTDGVDVDVEQLIAGYAAAVRDEEPAVSEGRLRRELRDLERRLRAERARELIESDEVFAALARSNADKAAQYISRFEQREGAEVLPGGVVYELAARGGGETVGELGVDAIMVNLEVDRLDGREVFAADGYRLELEGMLPGGRELMDALRVGDRALAIIPPDQAFGVAGEPPLVGPNEALVVSVEVLGVAEDEE